VKYQGKMIVLQFVELRLKPEENLHLEIGSHSLKLIPVSFDKINPAPFSCDASRPAWPEQSIAFSAVKWSFPVYVHLISLTPRIASSSLLISLATWYTLPAW